MTAPLIAAVRSTGSGARERGGRTGVRPVAWGRR